MTRPAHPPSGALRALLGIAAVAIAWVVVLAQLATTLHFALISHEVCAVHGELVHRAIATGAHSAHHATGTAALPASGDADDDHCPLLSRAHDQLALLPSSHLEIASAAPQGPTPG